MCDDFSNKMVTFVRICSFKIFFSKSRFCGCKFVYMSKIQKLCMI